MVFDISKITIPSQPGVYLMKDKDDKVIYVGKAKNLRNRIRSYFLKNQNYKTEKLVQKIQDIEFILTDNEAEALDRKSTRLNSSHIQKSRMPSSA